MNGIPSDSVPGDNKSCTKTLIGLNICTAVVGGPNLFHKKHGMKRNGYYMDITGDLPVLE